MLESKTHKKFFLIYLLALNCLCACTLGSDFVIKDGERVVFYGDSITDNQLYPRIIEDFVITRHQNMDVQFWNRGWGGDTANYYQRFKRDCLSLEPTLVFICLGMNDADYRHFDLERYKSYVRNLDRMIDDLRKISAKAILISPPAYDVEQQPVLTHPGDHKVRNMYFYPEVLREFSLGMSAIAVTNYTKYVDLNNQYSGLLAAGKIKFGDKFRLSKEGDAVHPHGPGQFAMAVIILQSIGATDEVAYLEIDTAETAKSKFRRTSIENTNVTENNVSFYRKDDCLPMPAYEDSEPVATMLDVPETLNRNWLAFRNLPEGTYKLEIDGRHIVTLHSDGWAKGVNLNKYSYLPEIIQAKQVSRLTSEIHDLKYKKWRQILCKNIKWVGDSSPYNTENTKKLTEIEELIFEKQLIRKKTSIPEIRHYNLIKIN